MGGDRHSISTVCFEFALEFVGKEQVSEFALAVGFVLVIVLFAIQVVKIDMAGMMESTADGDDTCFGSLQDSGQQPAVD